MGLGWSFYGFFIAAVAYLFIYFLWAFGAAARDRRSITEARPDGPRGSDER